MKTLIRLVIVGVSISLAGCAINRATGTFDPGQDIVNSDVFYVERFNPDNRELHKLIADNLSTRGYKATFGEEGSAPDDATIVVTYVDKWMWDITMYLIELTITLRDPESGAAIGSGNSYHTSLSRLSPEQMVDEVLTNILAADAGETSN
ncbi:MAG: hypothetical protein OEQ16_00035 [Gammaproteobacteria bacterium]|jgi:hypothetical protein|nr:hypothetical protein [Gammaproteobacteria bacterium]MDH3819658.1 hypothetical protein [Gammaproteobacteria bacterium]